MIETTKNLNKLAAQKDQFENILDNITKRMTSKEGGITFATYDSINKKIKELENKITKLMEGRKGLIIRANEKISNNLNIDKNESLNLSEERAEILNNIEETSKKRSNIQKRINDLNNLIIKLDIEIKKLKRTKSVGDIFLKIPISHCPACDQSVDAKNDLKKCFLCNQPIDLPDSEDRVKYELKKFQSEKNELIKIITILKQNLSDVIKEGDILKEKLNYIERRLFSVRQKITALLDSRLELIDAERGRVEEQIVNYNRILGNLDYKKEIENKIKELNKEIEVYQKSIEEISSKIDFVTAIENLEEGMANYINLLNEPKKRWELGRVKFTFAERNFSFKISGSKWNSLSGTYKIYFLFAYHFSLLSLSHKNNNHYPGFVIIDFLPEPPDELERETRLNYLITPFVELCNNSTEPIQLILAGRGFNTIKNAHIKELKKVWK